MDRNEQRRCARKVLGVDVSVTGVGSYLTMLAHVEQSLRIRKLRFIFDSVVIFYFYFLIFPALLYPNLQSINKSSYFTQFRRQ